MNIKRDKDGVAHIVALSGGKDSTAMAVWLTENEPRNYSFVCTPTGNELPEMFAHWRKLGTLLGSRIQPLMAGTLKSVMEDQQAVPNFRMRFCTRILKLAPFKTLLLQAMPAVAYVGLRADESEEDRTGADYGGDVRLSGVGGIVQRYPLRELGWGVQNVMQFLYDHGIEIPERTDCARCFFQRLGEWFKLWQDYPAIYEDAVQDEKRWGHTYRSDQRDSWPASLEALRNEFRKGRIPEISLKMMERRKGMCRACSL